MRRGLGRVTVAGADLIAGEVEHLGSSRSGGRRHRGVRATWQCVGRGGRTTGASSRSWSLTTTPTTRCAGRRAGNRAPDRRRCRRCRPGRRRASARERTILDLGGDLQRRLDVAERSNRRGAAGRQEVRRATADRVAGEQPGQHRHRAGLGVGAVDARARGFEPGKLSADVVVDRLVDQRERGRRSVFARVERGGETPVGAEATEGEDRSPAATLGVGDQPLELAHLVATPAAWPKAPSSFTQMPRPDNSRTGVGRSESTRCGSVSLRAGKRACSQGVKRERLLAPGRASASSASSA